MSANVDNCQECGASFIGGPIPKYDHQDDCSDPDECVCLPYGNETHWRREMGHEVGGVYDGVLYWSCQDCGYAWPRFPDGWYPEARAYIDAHNNGRIARTTEPKS